MFSNQNYNNEENNDEIYVNDSRLQRIGLYISDTFDQTSFETVDFTEEEYNAFKNVQSHLVRTRMVPVRAFRTPKPTTVLSDGFNSIQIISNDENIGNDLIQTNSNQDGTQRSVYLMNDNVKMLARRKCVLQPGGRQKVENDEYHAVIVHEPEAKIPRPPNAFMIFANEWRKKVAHKFNNESNKDISVRLGQMWRSLDKSRKEEYFVMARKADAEHKMKYPDYVYNPKEARLRKALRDSWKDKGKHNLHEQGRCVTGKSNGENWLPSQSTQNRKLLPMPSVSSMTFSMAADGYSMMETPAWSNSWYPYRHNSVPYIVPQMSETYTGDPNTNAGYSDRMYHQTVNIQQSEVRSSVINPCRSPFANGNEPEVTKEPLSQLQELANVFSPSVPCNRAGESEAKEFTSSKSSDVKFANSSQIKIEVESSINHDSDSGYVTDQPQQAEGTGHVNEYGKNIGKTGVTDVLMTENSGEPFIESFENGTQSNYINMDDVFLDCNFLSGEKNFGGSNTSLDITDQGKNVLPGFHQAFGSTEIGRFSRNDFFTSAPPETTEKVSTPTSQVETQKDVELPTRKMRAKPVRKPRKLKNSTKKTDESDGRTHLNSPEEYPSFEKKNGCVRKGRKPMSNNEKSDLFSRHHSVMSEQEPFGPSPFEYPSSGQVPAYGGQTIPNYRDESLAPAYHLPRNQMYPGVEHSCGNQYLRPPDPVFPHSYESGQHRYGYPADYPPSNSYPYARNNYPNYSNYEYPYFRPFGFHLDHGDTWPNSNANWSAQGWMGPNPPPPQQPSYNSWTSSNMFPFMRISKLPKPESHPWNPTPIPSNFQATPAADSDYFNELCDMEEPLLRSHSSILADSDFLSLGPIAKNNGQKKQKPEVVQPCNPKKKGTTAVASTVTTTTTATAPTASGDSICRGDELMDMLTMVIDDIDDFNVDELLLAGSEKFNLCEVNNEY